MQRDIDLHEKENFEFYQDNKGKQEEMAKFRQKLLVRHDTVSNIAITQVEIERTEKKRDKLNQRLAYLRRELKAYRSCGG